MTDESQARERAATAEREDDAVSHEPTTTDGVFSALRRLIGAAAAQRAAERELAKRLERRIEAMKRDFQNELASGRELRQRYREVKADMTQEQRDAFFEGYLESLRHLTAMKAAEMQRGFIEDLVACRGASPTSRARAPLPQPEPLVSETAGERVPGNAGSPPSGDADGR